MSNARNPHFISLVDIDFKQQITDWFVEHSSEFNNDQLNIISFIAESVLLDRDKSKGFDGESQ